jgi:hypothetical protein
MENGKKYVTWQALLGILGGALLAITSIGWSFHCVAKAEVVKQIDTKVDKEEYRADIGWIKSALERIEKRR